MALPRVVIVDDHVPVLEYLARLLREEFTVAGRASDAESLLEQWRIWRPDVIVLDISLPGCSGLEAARRLRRADCDVPVVFLSFHQEPEIVRAAWAAGGGAYVAKQDIGLDLAPAIRAALAGRRFVSRAVEVR
jgi:two-component system response regulator NreC